MKTYLSQMVVVLLALGTHVQAHSEDKAPLVYVNQNLGFNVPGYHYAQNEFPCNIDTHLVEYLLEDAKKLNLMLEPVGTADKINNGIAPVLAMDIEELVLGEDFQYGTKTRHNLPKVKVTAAVIKGKELTTAKHTCAIATLNEFTPSSNVLDLGANTTVCGATKKCLRDLSKDIMEWAAPQVQ